MADPHGFLEVPKVEAAKRAVDERVGDWREVYERQDPHRAGRRGVPAGPSVHGLRNPVLPLRDCRLPAGQPHPGMERPGAAGPVGRRERSTARHQQLPGVHRPAVPGAVRSRLCAVHRRREDRRQRHHQAHRADHRRSSVDGRHRSSRSPRPSRPARASPWSAPDPRDWLPRNNSPAPDTTSRCTSAMTGLAA